MMKVPPRNKGKPGKEVLLPNRGAMNALTSGPPKTVLDYAQITPNGLNAPQTYPQLVQMGLTAGKRRPV